MPGGRVGSGAMMRVELIPEGVQYRYTVRKLDHKIRGALCGSHFWFIFRLSDEFLLPVVRGAASENPIKLKQ